MKKILQILIIFCLSLFIYDKDGGRGLSSSDDGPSAVHENCTFYSDSASYFSATGNVIYAPRPTGSANLQRVNAGNIKRVSENVRNNSLSVAQGRIINHNTVYHIQEGIDLYPTGYSSHSQHIISLGKLII